MLGKQETPFHERQPLAVSVSVVLIDVVVVILPVPRARVVRGVDVDAVDLARVRELQRFKDVMVLALDHHMTRSFSASLNRPETPQPREDRFTEASQHDQRLGGHLLIDDFSLLLLRQRLAVCVLDLPYREDSIAEVDANVVMTADQRLIEVQGTAERGAFDRTQLDAMLDLAAGGIRQLVDAQRAAVARGMEGR